MIRQIPKVAVLLGVLAFAGQASAHGGNGWGPGLVTGAVVGALVGGAVVANSAPRPVYVEQQPVYVAPQPVYYAPPPPPVYYQQPVVVAPAPVYYRQGYYGHPHYYGYGPGRW
ncbi:hypothetical protein [Pseudomonas sp. NA-150]|uniref:hypothetical protein n=1 Tax=Pseudomonas sp. NA-150 TaxID=3367525 RepID=UPI0037C70D92